MDEELIALMLAALRPENPPRRTEPADAANTEQFAGSEGGIEGMILETLFTNPVVEGAILKNAVSEGDIPTALLAGLGLVPFGSGMKGMARGITAGSKAAGKGVAKGLGNLFNPNKTFLEFLKGNTDPYRFMEGGMFSAGHNIREVPLEEQAQSLGQYLIDMLSPNRRRELRAAADAAAPRPTKVDPEAARLAWGKGPSRDYRVPSGRQEGASLRALDRRGGSGIGNHADLVVKSSDAGKLDSFRRTSDLNASRHDTERVQDFISQGKYREAAEVMRDRIVSERKPVSGYRIPDRGGVTAHRLHEVTPAWLHPQAATPEQVDDVIKLLTQRQKRNQ